MTIVQYHFAKEPEGWIIYSQQGVGDHRITKDLMKEKLYDAFQEALPTEQHVDVDKCRMKLPTYLQFAGRPVNTDNGTMETTIELYIRKNTIEQANMIVQGTQGTIARVPVERFNLDLAQMDLGAVLPDEPVDLTKGTFIDVPALWSGTETVQ